MRYTICILAAFVVTGAFLMDDALADQRSYVWTYEYMTLPRGEAEIETYFTLSTPDKGEFEGNVSTEHRIELEVGMTDRFDFGIYQIFSQAPGENLEYKRFQVRSRYRIGEKGKYFVDPLVYVEYKAVPDFSEHGLEAKLILARDFGRLNVSVNPIVEFEFEDENEIETEYTVGTSYLVNEFLRVGIEAKGGEAGHYVGPVISHGNENFWVALGSAANVGSVDEGRAEFQARMLLGMGL
jgi:hypothetical protein